MSQALKETVAELLDIKMIDTPVNHFHWFNLSVFCLVSLCSVADMSKSLILLPYLGIRDKVSDWDEFLRQTLTGACSPPVPLLEGVSIIACRISVGNPPNL